MPIILTDLLQCTVSVSPPRNGGTNTCQHVATLWHSLIKFLNKTWRNTNTNINTEDSQIQILNKYLSACCQVKHPLIKFLNPPSANIHSSERFKILLMSRVHDTWNLLMTHLLWKTPWFPLQQPSPRQLIPETEDYPFEIWTLVTVNFERGAGV